MDQLPDPRKKLIIISFTETGTELNRRLCKELGSFFCAGYAPERLARGVEPLPKETGPWIGSLWGGSDFLFIGAAGIAVRMTAPFVKDKFTDSAVLAMDERGRYVIPLLSGHVGGGVERAGMIAEYTGACPVITTATDIQGKFAVDLFAGAFRLAITDRRLARQVSACILEGKQAGIYADPDCLSRIGGLKEEIQRYGELGVCRTMEELDGYEAGIAVTQSLGAKSDRILYLLPKNLAVGVGCRKGISAAVLEEGIGRVLSEQGMIWEQVAVLVSIDLKAREPGLLELSGNRGLHFLTYTAGELAQTDLGREGSEFVRKITGVDDVCERSVRYYLRNAPGAEVIQKKKCLEGMTVAVGRWM